MVGFKAPSDRICHLRSVWLVVDCNRLQLSSILKRSLQCWALWKATAQPDFHWLRSEDRTENVRSDKKFQTKTERMPLSQYCSHVFSDLTYHNHNLHLSNLFCDSTFSIFVLRCIVYSCVFSLVKFSLVSPGLSRHLIQVGPASSSQYALTSVLITVHYTVYCLFVCLLVGLLSR